MSSPWPPELPDKCKYCDCTSFEDHPYNGGAFIGRHFLCGFAVLPFSERIPLRWHEWRGEFTVARQHMDYMAVKLRQIGTNNE